MESKERTPCGLEKTIDQFQSKLQRVEIGIKLLDVLHYSVDGKYTLQEISSDICDLKAMNEVIRSKIDAEKMKMETMKVKQKERLIEVRKRMNHICYHLPESVPELSPKLKTSDINDIHHNEAPAEVHIDKENKKPGDAPQSKGKKLVKCINLLQRADFVKIPKHVKGHLTMEQINAGISEVNVVLQKKYDFLKRSRRTLTRVEDKTRTVYLEMGKELKGTAYEIFFMDSDIQQYGGVIKTKPKTRETVFLVLRHLGKLKEIRRGKPPRYCILGG